MVRYCFSILVTVFLFGCAVAQPHPSEDQIETLSKHLQYLSEDIPHTEALQLSRDIFAQTALLVKVFDLTSPPLWHNFLVNIGIRQKGLCYHWSDALYLHVTKQKYASFDFHLMGANIGEYLFEHNALLVSAKNGKIEEGIIIDPWRNSGKLYFVKMKEDPNYQWFHRPRRCCQVLQEKGR